MARHKTYVPHGVIPAVILVLLVLAALILGYEFHVFGLDILIDFPAFHA